MLTLMFICPPLGTIPKPHTLSTCAAGGQVGALRQHVAEKDAGLNMAREENVRLKEGMGMYQKELERLTSENRILKRAVGIQNTKGKEVGFGFWVGFWCDVPENFLDCLVHMRICASFTFSLWLSALFVCASFGRRGTEYVSATGLVFL